MHDYSCVSNAKLNAGSTIVDIIERRDSKDGGERVVRMLNSWSLIRARKKWEESVVSNIQLSCRGVPCVWPISCSEYAQWGLNPRVVDAVKIWPHALPLAKMRRNALRGRNRV